MEEEISLRGLIRFRRGSIFAHGIFDDVLYIATHGIFIHVLYIVTCDDVCIGAGV